MDGGRYFANQHRDERDKGNAQYPSPGAVQRSAAGVFRLGLARTQNRTFRRGDQQRQQDAVGLAQRRQRGAQPATGEQPPPTRAAAPFVESPPPDAPTEQATKGEG